MNLKSLYILIFVSLIVTLFIAYALWQNESAEETMGMLQHVNLAVELPDLGKSTLSLAPKQRIQIMIASNGSRLAGMMATINSIVSNTKHELFFFLITSESSVHYLIKWIENSKLRGISYAVHGYTQDLRGGFVKLKILELFPEIRGKLIYLEDDCIVQGDINDLSDTILEPGHFGLVSSDCFSVSKQFGQIKKNYAAHMNFRHPQIKALHMDPGSCSFDFGVFMTNITEWLQHDLTDRLHYWMRLNYNNSIFINPQKDDRIANAALMLVFYHRISVMNPMWHVRHLGTTTGSQYSERFLHRAKLLHWDGQFKPWSRRSAHTKFWDRYFVPDPTRRFHLIRKNKSVAFGYKNQSTV